MPALSTSSTGILEIIEYEILEKAPDGSTVSNRYGINVNKVREVIKSVPIARTAKDHPAMEGIIELRGEVIPVVHLPKWLGKFDPQFKYEQIIIAEFNQLRAGLLVNRVHRIHHVPYAQLHPPTPFMGGTKEAVMTGVVRNEGKILMMPDYEYLLADIDPATVDDPTPIPPAPRTGGNLLVVEDSGIVKTILRQTFGKAGYSVIEAGNGVEAVEKLEEEYKKAQLEGIHIVNFVHAVVTGVEMPLMDGMSLVARIKSEKRWSDIPVIIYSSMAEGERVERWKAAGADECVAKPDISKLVRAVNELSLTA